MTNVPAATWLTNAQGCVVYRGSAFPSNYLGNVFIADPSAHVIHRAVLREAGLDVTAVRAPDETNTEFVASPDPAFAPCKSSTGPTARSTLRTGRTPATAGAFTASCRRASSRPNPRGSAQATTYDLAAMLSHPNGWQRDTAARLLYERRDPKAVPPLANLLANSRDAPRAPARLACCSTAWAR